MDLSLLRPFQDLIVVSLITALLTTLIAWFWVASARRKAAEQAADEVSQRFAQERVALQAELAECADQLTAYGRDVEHAQQALHETRRERDIAQAALSDERVERAAIAARLDAERASTSLRERSEEQSRAALKVEFESIAAKLFDDHGQRFSSRSSEQLTSLLEPFREQIGQFQRQVEQNHRNDLKDRSSILAEIAHLQQATARVNDEAANLTQALKGDSKVQGSWGELVLERILEGSGLVKGREYFTQSTFRNTLGESKRPDVIVRLPDSKDVVIDAKVSLTAYERSLAADNDTERARQVQAHLASLKAHIKGLSGQDYDGLEALRSLDFVLLFVPIESAFTLALEADPDLFTAAFEQRIVIVSPTTLMMTLRVISNVWRYEHQSNNAEEIARRAAQLYDKVRLVGTELEALARHLDGARASHDRVLDRLTEGRGNVIRQVESFRSLGARAKESIPKSLLDRALAEDPLAPEEGATTTVEGSAGRPQPGSDDRPLDEA